MFKTDVRHVLETHRCLRLARVPQLWEDDPALTHIVGDVGAEGRRRIPVRASTDFEWLLFEGAWAREARSQDVGWALLRLLDRLVPDAASMFRRRYTAQVMLEANAYNAQKAFVYAVIRMSKWLGEHRFPHGVHTWPPVPTAQDLIEA